MIAKTYQQIELKFWRIVIPQLSPTRPLGRLLCLARELKSTIPLVRFSLIAFSGSLVGTLSGVLLFSIFS